LEDLADAGILISLVAALETNMWHDIVYYILLIVLLLTGLLINVLTLPGLWLMAASYGAYALLTGWNRFVGWPSLIAMAVLATIAEVVELTAGSAGAKKAGASKRAMIAAVVGGMVGAVFLTALIPIPIVGTIIGVCLGAALGAGIVELMVRRDLEQSIRVGTGAFKGRLLGIVSKLVFGAVMLLIAMICGFPH
jgi:uncharacterized protein YqgC (DUF456 family)